MSNSTSEAHIVQLPEVCLSFPSPLSHSVPRDNLLGIIAVMFEAGASVVVMQGEEGIGNTTLLAQFCERHPTTAISLFIRPTNSLFYNLANLRFDLCNQMNWILRGQELESPDDVDDVLRNKLLLQLAQHARRTGKYFTFVVDGLAEIPDNDAQFRAQVAALLPWNTNRIRILLSGNQERLPIPPGITPKVASGVPFLPSETVSFFGDQVEPEVAQEAHRLCSGVPGQLALLKNLFATEGDARRVLSDAPRALDDLFELSWRQVPSSRDSTLLLDLLALMAHGRRTHTISELSRVVGATPTQTRELLCRLSFVTIGTGETPQPPSQGSDAVAAAESSQEPVDEREVRFLSESFRRFAARKLEHLRKKANDFHIEYLLGHPDNPNSVADLPIYYRQAGRNEDLLNYLDSDNLAKILDQTHSLAVVQATADAGLLAAKELRRDREMMQLSIQKSALAELENAQSWRSEAEARMALRDYDAAFGLTQNAVLHEDRLHLLAIIAGSKCKQDLPVEAELSEQIEQLCRQINPPTMRERAMEIACDLLPSHPALAMDLVERANTSETGENALDWAFAHLSFEAARQRAVDDQSDERELRLDTSLEGITSRIQDPEARRFASVVSQLYGYGKFSGSRILAEAHKLPDVGAQMYLLRHWAQGNAEHPDAPQVLAAALRLLVDAGTYVSTIRDLRDLAAPLPFIADEEEVRLFVGRFDALRSTIEWAATEDDIAVQLLLAQAESKYDTHAASCRVEEIYYVVSELEDLAVKTGCLGRMVASLDDIDPTHAFEDDKKIHTSARVELEVAFDLLLRATADHHEATRGIVRALAKTQPDLALALISKLNTVTRRDQALSEFVDSAVRVLPSRLDLRSIESALKLFDNPDSRDYSLVEAIKRLDAIVEKVLGEGGSFPFDKAAPLLDRIPAVADLQARCIGCCFGWSLLNRAGREADAPRRQKLLQVLEGAWESIDAAWHKIEIGFKIASALSEQDPELARSYVARAEEVQRSLSLDNSVCAASHLSCLFLGIRAYAGLLPRNVDSPEDLDRLMETIDDVPSHAERVRLYTDLVIRCFLQGRHATCHKLVNERLIVLLNNWADLKSEYQESMVTFAAPALYCAHRATALNRIERLPLLLRDSAYDGICQFLLKKKSPYDPFDAPSRHAYGITFEDALDICSVLDLVDFDAIIYHHITCIVDSATSSRTLITTLQKVELAESLQSIIAKKFPNARHITHQGYVVAARAQLARLRKTSRPMWDDLVQQARDIDNLADRAFVLSIVAAAMRSAGVPVPDVVPIFDEAAEVVERIPVPSDQIDHYERLARMAGEVDAASGRKYSTKVMELTNEINNPQSLETQQRMIDYWYRVDPTIASAVAAKADSDPARENLKSRLQMLELKTKIADQKLKPEEVDAALRSQWINAIWMHLGQMYANRAGACHREYARPYIELAAGGSMQDAYKIMSWVIENTVRRHSKTDQAREFLRPVFEAMLQGAELSIKMAARNAQTVERAKRNAVGSSGNVSVIDVGERGKALDLITEWLQTSTTEYVKVCDPYLDPVAVCEILHLVREANPTLNVQILTSFEGLSAEQAKAPKDAYLEQWRRTYDQSPPETRVVIVGTRQSSKSPFHDRWWITEDSGLSTGTSFNGYGARLHLFVRLSADEAQENEQKLDEYLQMRKQQHDADRLRYEAFTLDM